MRKSRPSATEPLAQESTRAGTQCQHRVRPARPQSTSIALPTAIRATLRVLQGAGHPCRACERVAHTRRPWLSMAAARALAMGTSSASRGRAGVIVDLHRMRREICRAPTLARVSAIAASLAPRLRVRRGASPSRAVTLAARVHAVGASV